MLKEFSTKLRERSCGENEYIKKENSFVMEYQENTPGCHVSSYEGLLEIIGEHGQCQVQGREEVIRKFWEYGNKDMKCLYHEIKSLPVD